MPRIKISQLPETASLTPTDLLTAVANVTSSKITVRNLSNSLTKVTSSIMADTASSADNFTVRNNLYGADAYFTGTINANTLKVSIVSSSVVYSSGSNIFGDDASDTQQFTGSVLIRDSVVIPRFSSDPGGAQEGQLYYNTVDDNVYRYTSTGWQSAAGSSGTSGQAGVVGSSGTSGQSGAGGSSGTSGQSGASGANGSSGTSGQTGAAGSSGTSGTGFSTISNAGNLRVLLSDGSSNAAAAQTNLRFDGTTLQVSGSLAVGTITPSLTAGRIDAGNDVVAFSTSDQRLKTEITPIENALSKVMATSGVNFTWIENIEVHGNSGRDVGVIAQEIEAVLPEVVTTRDNGYKAVKYEKIVPLLIEAIKDLQKQIEELKASK